MILATIKAASLQARKDKNAKVSTLLTTLISDAQMIGKNNGDREVTEGEVIGIIKKYIINATETRQYIYDIPVRLNAVDREQIDKCTADITLLNTFLPSQLTESELVAAINDSIAVVQAKTIKDMGKVMKVLKDAFDGRYDGATASTLIKAKLNVVV